MRTTEAQIQIEANGRQRQRGRGGCRAGHNNIRNTFVAANDLIIIIFRFY